MASSLAFGGIAVSPGIVEKNLVAGDNVIELIVSNNSDKALEIELAAGPLAHDVQGRSVPGKPDSLQDASSLVRFEKPKFILAAKRWRRVRAHVSPPKHGGGGGYSFLYVRGIEANLPAGTEVVVRMELGVLAIFGYPGESSRAAEITDLVSTRDGAKVRVRNTGNIHVRPEGRVVVRDASGKELWAGQIAPSIVFPGLERELSVDGLPELPPGQYTAAVELSSPSPVQFARTIAQIDGQLLVSRPRIDKR